MSQRSDQKDEDMTPTHTIEYEVMRGLDGALRGACEVTAPGGGAMACTEASARIERLYPGATYRLVAMRPWRGGVASRYVFAPGGWTKEIV